MITIVLIVHILIALVLITVVLLQRSEGGALGIGGNPAGGFMTGRGAASILTRTTAVLAAAFICTSIGLALLAGGNSNTRSILEISPGTGESAPLNKTPSRPSVPLSQ